jgi:hypothetical protein
MLRTIALTLTLAFAFGGVTTTLTGCKRRHKRHKRYKKHKKHKKNKWKGSSPEISVEEAKKSAEGIGKRLYKAAFKGGDFGKIKGIALMQDKAKDFAKAEMFAKWASTDKMKEKLKKWAKKFKKAKFRKVKVDSEMTIEPGKAPKDKWKIVADNITKPVKLRPGKVFGKRKSGEQYKCSYVAIKLADNDWRLLRIKSCKSAD